MNVFNRCAYGDFRYWPFTTGRLFSSRPSLTGHCGHGWTSSLPRPVASDPTATSTDSITFPRRRFFGYLVGRCRIHDNAHNHNWTSQDRRSIHSASLLSDKREPNMNDTTAYTPPEVWVWAKDDSPKWRYSNINRPIAGATHEKELARGKHPLQLYSLARPRHSSLARRPLCFVQVFGRRR